MFHSKTLSDSASASSCIGVALLLLANLTDLYATLTAHRMFYRWSNSGKDISFFSTATKVDASVSLLHSSASLVAALSMPPFERILTKSALALAPSASAFLSLSGALLNVAASLPSLDFVVPGAMARAQNVVVALFLMSALTRLHVASAIAAFGENESYLPSIMIWHSFAADVLLLVGASLNFIRVKHLLKKVQHWASDGAKRGAAKPEGGILSWFKSSRSNAETSDFDSDMDDLVLDSEEEDRGNASSRRARWSRV